MNELERWETRFGPEAHVFGTAPNRSLARHAPLLTAEMGALSIADGEGRNGVWLAQQGLHVTSQNFSPTAQDKARRQAEDRGMTLAFELSESHPLSSRDAANHRDVT